MKHFLTVIILLVLAIGSVEAKDMAFTVKDGQLGACLIKIAVPARWNGNLLILAHGLKADNQPLSVDLEADKPFPRKLISEGWLVASTSYRRNGWIVGDAIEDIEALRTYLADTYGKPKHCYLYGASMGGMIVTRMAEMLGGRYDGAIAIGAALQIDAADPREKLCFSPRIHLLFMSNRNELDGPKDYVSRASHAPVVPALWHVERDGHCNVTYDERLAAFRALIRYHDKGRISRDKDATIVPPVPPSVAVFKDGRAFAKVAQQGNIDTDFTAADLAKLGIAKGSYLVLRFGDKSARVLFGTTYGDVPVGDWVCFMKAEGFLRIARNYENASATLGCKAGDVISIEREVGGQAGK